MGYLRSINNWLQGRSYARWVAVLLVLVAGLGASVYFWNNARSRLDIDIVSRYQRQVDLTKALITLRLQQYTNLLNGGAGYLLVNPEPTEDEWSAFYHAYDLAQNYPGVDAVSFSRYVRNEELTDYLNYIRGQGRGDFTIRPAGNHDAYAPITYIAALSPVSYQSFGFDPLSDSIRGPAMTRARDLGMPVMTEKVTLIAAHKGQVAFITYKPIYSGHPETVSERQATIYGYVFAATNMNNLLNSISNQIQNKRYALAIFDGTKASAAALMYQTSNFDSLKRHAIKLGTFALDVNNHTWTIELAASPDSIPISEQQQPMLMFLRGMLVSLVLSSIVWYVITWRERRMSYAKLEEVQAAKDELLTLASHQLRTPATIVKQNVGILLHNYAGKVAPQQRKLLRSAYESNQHQLKIINEFLNVAKLDSGRITLRKEGVKLNSLLEAIVYEQRKIATSRKQKITTKFPKRPIHVQADPEYLGVVFENLLSNASQYTPEHGSISVKLKKLNNEALISVSDTGVGMTEDQLEVIFDKFTRVKNDLTAEGSGSGVGLYLAEQIVLLHDGAIDVASTPGKGSTFIVRLPLATKQGRKQEVVS